MSLKMFPITECDCVICKSMCHAPCVGTPEEMEAIIEAGYGDRLCLDDWPEAPTDIHPALKGHESCKAPYATSSRKGCTFYKDGKCELHDKGLKPLGGKFAHHDVSKDEYMKIEPFLKKKWNSKKGKQVVEEWKQKFFKNDEEF